LFTPFDRLGAEQSDVQGTGLGLALCQRLMLAMNGSIGVNSTVNQGSTFWLELPRTASPLERIAACKRSSRDNGQQISGGDTRTILYIEDNLSNLTLIEQILEEQPEINLLTATEGKVGLELAGQHSPDLILLDLHLPDLPGWTVLARLQADDATRHIPVIVISADATVNQIKRLMAAGAHTYLTKPIDVTEFFHVLEQTLSLTNGSKQFVAA
jgi:CheY-like chemotaxis protein